MVTCERQFMEVLSSGESIIEVLNRKVTNVFRQTLLNLRS